MTLEYASTDFIVVSLFITTSWPDNAWLKNKEWPKIQVMGYEEDQIVISMRIV